MQYTYKVYLGIRGYVYSVYRDSEVMRARPKEYRTRALAESAAKRAVKRLADEGGVI